MSGAADPPEPDRVAGCAHPRETFTLFGHEAAEQALAEAIGGGRMHHAWLLAGPEGVGKATLAYRAARRLLAARPSPETPLASAPEDPICRRIASGAHPDLLTLRRGLGDRGKLRREIVVDEARALAEFFALHPAEGGFRVAVIDRADDLNRNAANAILKTLEEPPARAVVFLVAQAPGKLLATIRSRCRRLMLRATSEAAVAQALQAAGREAAPALLRLAAGRPGQAVALAAQGAEGLAETLLDALAATARKGPATLLELAFARDGAGDAADRLDRFLTLAEDLCRRAAAHALGISDPHEPPRAADVLARLAPPGRALAWAQAHARLGALRDEAEGLSLDPAHAYLRAAAVIAEVVQAK